MARPIGPTRQISTAGLLRPVARWLDRSTNTTTDSGFSLVGGVSAVFILVGSVLGLTISIWNYGFRQGKTGQTVGKGFMGIAVVTSDGEYLGVIMSLLRTIVMSILGSLCFLNYLGPLFDDQNRAWHDMIVNSLVLDAD